MGKATGETPAGLNPRSFAHARRGGDPGSQAPQVFVRWPTLPLLSRRRPAAANAGIQSRGLRRVVASSCRRVAAQANRDQRRQRDSEQPPKRLWLRYADAEPCLRHCAGDWRGDPGRTVPIGAQNRPAFRVDETTIAQIHAALKGGTPHLPGARPDVSAPHRRVRQAGPGNQRDRPDQSGGARRGRGPRPSARRGRHHRPPALHPGHRQRQLRDRRTAERRRVAGAEGIRLDPRRVPGAAPQGRRSDRARQVEHGGVGVHAVRDGQLDSARLHEEPLRAGSRDRRIERRHGRGGRREPRRRWPRQRYRQLDPRAVVSSGAGRHSFDDGADEPGRGDSAQLRWRTSRGR